MDTLLEYQEKLEEQARRAFGFSHFAFDPTEPSAHGSVWEAKRTPLSNVQPTTEFSLKDRPFIHLTRTDFGLKVIMPDPYSAIRAIEKQAHDVYENNQNEIRKLRLLLYRFDSKKSLSGNEINLRKMIRLRLKKAILKSKKLKLHPTFLQLPPLYCDPSNRIEIAAPSNLYDYLSDNYERKNKKLTLAEAQQLIAQILLAVEYLHGQAHIVHLDIKPKNLLVHKRKNGGVQIALIDSEDSAAIDASGKWVSFFGKLGNGTMGYCSPEYLKAILVDQKSSNPNPSFKTAKEMINNTRYLDHRKIDSFSVGKTIEDILGQTEGGYSESAKKLVSQLTNSDPNKRLSISAAKQSEFFGNPDQRRQLFKEAENSATNEVIVNSWLVTSAPTPGDTYYILPAELQEVSFLKDKFQNQLGIIKVYAELLKDDDYAAILETIAAIFNTKRALSIAINKAENAGYGKALTLPNIGDDKLLMLIIKSLELDKKLQNTLISTRILEFAIKYFAKHSLGAHKHTRHQELLELFQEVRAAETSQIDILPILQKWERKWHSGTFGFFYAGECGGFAARLIRSETEKATSCAAEEKQAYADYGQLLIRRAQSSR